MSSVSKTNRLTFDGSQIETQMNPLTRKESPRPPTGTSSFSSRDSTSSSRGGEESPGERASFSPPTTRHSCAGDSGTSADDEPAVRGPPSMTTEQAALYRKAVGVRRLSKIITPYVPNKGGKNRYLCASTSLEDGVLFSQDMEENKKYLRELRQKFSLRHPVNITLSSTKSFFSKFLRHVVQISGVVSTVISATSRAGNPFLHFLAIATTAFLFLLVQQLRVKTISDVHKQSIYFDMFNFGALVDFEVKRNENLSYLIALFCSLTLMQIFLIPDDVISQPLKFTAAIATFNSCVDIRGYYLTLQYRMCNILSFNAMFQSDHKTARDHCQRLTVIPFRVVKAVFCFVFYEKRVADMQVEKMCLAMSGSREKSKQTKIKWTPVPHKVAVVYSRREAQLLFDAMKNVYVDEDNTANNNPLSSTTPKSEKNSVASSKICLQELYTMVDERSALQEAMTMKNGSPWCDFIVFKKMTTHELYMRCLMVLEARDLQNVGKVALSVGDGGGENSRPSEAGFEDGVAKKILNRIKREVNDEAKPKTIMNTITFFRKTRNIMEHMLEIYEDTCTAIDMNFAKDTTRVGGVQGSHLSGTKESALLNEWGGDALDDEKTSVESAFLCFQAFYRKAAAYRKQRREAARGASDEEQGGGDEEKTKKKCKKDEGPGGAAEEGEATSEKHKEDQCEVCCEKGCKGGAKCYRICYNLAARCLQSCIYCINWIAKSKWFIYTVFAYASLIMWMGGMACIMVGLFQGSGGLTISVQPIANTTDYS